MAAAGFGAWWILVVGVEMKIEEVLAMVAGEHPQVAMEV